MESHAAIDGVVSVDDSGEAERVMHAERAHAKGTVFVIDDDVSVRESLETLIRTAGWLPEAFTSAEEFLSRPRRSVPCCVVLDVTLPGLSGLELQRHLAVRSDMPIIFVTAQRDVQTTVQAMKAGALDFLTKPFRDQALLDAIRHALDWSRAVARERADKRMLRTCYATLTSREREVMGLVVAGLLNKQIGAELGISEITVKTHRGRVMRKMNAESLPDLVMMAATLRLIGTRPSYHWHQDVSFRARERGSNT